jgi:hypothetical protein
MAPAECVPPVEVSGGIRDQAADGQVDAVRFETDEFTQLPGSRNLRHAIDGPLLRPE